MERPMPRVPPVTIAQDPLKSKFVFLLSGMMTILFWTVSLNAQAGNIPQEEDKSKQSHR